MRVRAAVFLFLAFFLAPASAAAHVVNLSQSDFTVSGANVHALVVFAKPDAARLGKMDPDNDGVVTPAELEASQDVFRALVEEGIDVTADGVRCPATLEGGGDTEGDGFGLSIGFACALPPRELGIALPLLRALLPGHRHLLRVQAGGASEQAVLTPDQPRLDLRISGASADAPPPRSGAVLRDAVRLGVAHILTGWDHLLFLLALLLGTRGLRPIALAVSAFTLAHSLTLALAALDVVAPSPRFVEPAIAASIAYVAFENVWCPGAPHRWRLAFVFGLVHGFGFAGSLRALALGLDRLLPTLVGFNLGVEVGQLLVMAALVPLVALLPRLARTGAGADETRLVRAASIAIGTAGLAVLVARIAFPS
jgi:hypothetical protein